MAKRFRDRCEGGRQLGAALVQRDLEAPVVLALPRGGVPVGVEVAAALHAPLEVFVARKVGAPGQPELAIGAIAEGSGVVSDRLAHRALGVTSEDFARLVEDERPELDRRVQLYRGGRPLPELAGRDVVLVDDGLATGLTAEAAVVGLREHAPRSIVLAVPVCSPETAVRMRRIADEVVCLQEPRHFHAVGQFYRDFTQTSDDEVLDLLLRSR